MGGFQASGAPQRLDKRPEGLRKNFPEGRSSRGLQASPRTLPWSLLLQFGQDCLHLVLAEIEQPRGRELGKALGDPRGNGEAR